MSTKNQVTLQTRNIRRIQNRRCDITRQTRRDQRNRQKAAQQEPKKPQERAQTHHCPIEVQVEQPHCPPARTVQTSEMRPLKTSSIFRSALIVRRRTMRQLRLGTAAATSLAVTVADPNLCMRISRYVFLLRASGFPFHYRSVLQEIAAAPIRFPNCFAVSVAQSHESQRNQPTPITNYRRSQPCRGKAVLNQTVHCAKVGTHSSRDSPSSANEKRDVKPHHAHCSKSPHKNI